MLGHERPLGRAQLMFGWRDKLLGGLDLQAKIFFERSMVVSIIRIAGLVCVFCLQILLARLIGDSGEYGMYAWGQSLLFMAGGITGMGVPVVTSRFIAALSAQDKEWAVAAVARRARTLMIRSTMGLVLIGASLWLVAPYFSGQSLYWSIAALALCLAPGYTATFLYQQMARGRQWLWLAFLPMQVARPILTGTLAIVLWYLNGNNLDGHQVLLVVGLSILLIYLPSSLIYQYRQSKISLTGEGSGENEDYHPTRLFRTARPILFARVAGMSIEYSSVLLVGILAGPAIAGAYFAAERLAGLVSMPASIVDSVNQTDVATAHARGDKEGLRILVRRAAYAMTWPTVVVTIILCVLSRELVSLFGDGFSEAAPVLVILAIGILLKTAVGPVHSLLLMTGFQRYLPRVLALAALVHVILLFVLVPATGAVGAAVTSSLSGVFSSVWLLLLVRRELGINPTIFPIKRRKDC